MRLNPYEPPREECREAEAKPTKEPWSSDRLAMWIAMPLLAMFLLAKVVFAFRWWVQTIQGWFGW